MDDRISPDSSIGSVSLTVRDLSRERGFYERTIGLSTLWEGDQEAHLGPAAGPVLVKLLGDPDAPPRPPCTTGLFHQALLVPDRTDLAVAVARLLGSGWRLTGVADHLVSEAVYLDDPEGNGIEIYRDRPREQWRRDGPDLRMATLQLDLPRLMEDLPEGLRIAGNADPGEMPPAPAGLRMGHVHLSVASLAESEAFYAGLLGFDVTVRGYPGALFLSAGGYHHHIGLNTWVGGDAPPAGSAGLREFEVLVPDDGELERIERRLSSAEAPCERVDGGLAAVDPSGNRVAIRRAG